MDECKPLAQGQLPGPARARRVRAAAGRAQGEAVQLHPIIPMLKSPGTKLLKVKCDILVSTSAFKFTLRRYSKADAQAILNNRFPVPRLVDCDAGKSQAGGGLPRRSMFLLLARSDGAKIISSVRG